jgi:hypothetical protein
LPKETLFVSEGQRGTVIKQPAVGARTVWKRKWPFRKRNAALKKIVILTDRSGKNHKLIRMLHALFPECDIQLRLKQPESCGNTSQVQKTTPHETGKKDTENIHEPWRQLG